MRTKRIMDFFVKHGSLIVLGVFLIMIAVMPLTKGQKRAWQQMDVCNLK